MVSFVNLTLGLFSSAFVVKRGITFGVDQSPWGLVAERLGARVLRAVGAPVQRMGFGSVSVNGAPATIMVVMEWPDEAFIKSRFGGEAAWDTCGLWKEGGDRLGGGGPRSPFAKTPEFQKLLDAARSSANTGDPFLAKRVDIDEFNRVYAATSAMDGADGEDSNAFFVWIASTGQFSMIRYDLEISFINAQVPATFFCGGAARVRLGAEWCLGLIRDSSFEKNLHLLLNSVYWKKQIYDDINLLVEAAAYHSNDHLATMFSEFVSNRTSFLRGELLL